MSRWLRLNLRYNLPFFSLLHLFFHLFKILIVYFYWYLILKITLFDELKTFSSKKKKKFFFSKNCEKN